MSAPKCLRITAGKEKGLRIPLISPPVTFGRAEDNRVILSPEIGASRHHAELAEDDGVWWVRDLGSMNGTYVNGERIEWPRVLHVGDKIKMAGDVMIHLVLVPSEENPSDPPSRGERWTKHSRANKSKTAVWQSQIKH